MNRGLMHVEDEDGFLRGSGRDGIIDPSGATRGRGRPKRTDRASNDGIISPPTLRPPLDLHPSMRPSWNLSGEGVEERGSIESSLITDSSGGQFPITRAYEQMRTGRSRLPLTDKVGTELSTDQGRDRVESSLSSASRLFPRGAASMPQKSDIKPKGKEGDVDLSSSRRKKNNNSSKDEQGNRRGKQDDDTLSTNRSKSERSAQQNRRSSNRHEEEHANKPKRSRQSQKKSKRPSDRDTEDDTADEGTRDGDRSRKSIGTRQSRQSSSRRRRRKRRNDVDGDNVVKDLVVTIMSGCCLMDQRDCSEMLTCYSDACDPCGQDTTYTKKKGSERGRRSRERRRGKSEPNKRNNDTDSEHTRSFTDCGTVTDNTTTTGSGSDYSRGGHRRSGKPTKSKKKPDEQRNTSMSPNRPPRKTRGRSPTRS